MKIKFSKDYSWKETMQEYDRRHSRECDILSYDFTTPSEYLVTWEDADVTQEQLEEYVSKGYAIRINC